MIYLRCDAGRALLVVAALGCSAFGSGCGDDDAGAAVTSGSGGAGASATGGQGGAGAAAGGAGGQPPTGGQGGAGGADTIPSLCNPSLIDPFGDFSGPVAVDDGANAFAGAYVLASDETVVRAYPSASVAPGMGATTGSSFFVFPGGSSQLAAVAPDGVNPGLVAIVGYGGEDPLVQAFTLTGGSVAPTGPLEPLVELVTDDLVSVTADDAGRLWVGIPDLDGQQLIVVARTPNADCLAPPAFESLVTIPPGAPWCVVGVHGAAAMPSVAPTWGRHGGLLTVKAGAAAGTVDIERWSSPADATAPSVPATTTVEIGVDEPIGTEIFLAYQAIDLPDFGWTLVSYTGLDGAGEVLAIEGDAVVERFDRMGFFSAAPVPGGAHGRLLYTGQSELGTTDPTGQAVYAADLCALASD